MLEGTIQALLAEFQARLEQLERLVSSPELQLEKVPNPDPLVTLDQAAAAVSRSKRTLEKYKKEMPAPTIKGSRGQPHLWRWSVLRPWLEKQFPGFEFRPDLPIAKRGPRKEERYHDE